MLDHDPDICDRIVFVMFTEYEKLIYEEVREREYQRFSYMWE